MLCYVSILQRCLSTIRHENITTLPPFFHLSICSPDFSMLASGQTAEVGDANRQRLKVLTKICSTRKQQKNERLNVGLNNTKLFCRIALSDNKHKVQVIDTVARWRFAMDLSKNVGLLCDICLNNTTLFCRIAFCDVKQASLSRPLGGPIKNSCNQRECLFYLLFSPSMKAKKRNETLQSHHQPKILKNSSFEQLADAFQLVHSRLLA